MELIDFHGSPGVMVPLESPYVEAAARAIQHEIDHTQGILFVDHLSALKKKLLQNKLRQISKGQVVTNYPMKFTG